MTSPSPPSSPLPEPIELLPIPDGSVLLAEIDASLSDRELVIRALRQRLEAWGLAWPIGPSLDLANPERLLSLKGLVVQLLIAGFSADEVTLPLNHWHRPGAAPQLVVAARLDEENQVVQFVGVMTASELEVALQADRAALKAESEVFAHDRVRFRPTNCSFRPDGGYYLGDGYGSHYIFEYTRQNEFVRAIGGKGTSDGQFQTPHGQWLDDRDGTPKLVVADRANQRLQWFDMEGKHLRSLGGFLYPADIDTQGDLMLVPDLHARLTLLDQDNNFITHLGDDPAWRTKVLSNNFKLRTERPNWQPGRFVHPHDACFDAEGNIFVVEWVVTGRVTKLVRVS